MRYRSFIFTLLVGCLSALICQQVISRQIATRDTSAAGHAQDSRPFEIKVLPAGWAGERGYGNYLEGKPIEIRLLIRNVSKETREVALLHPDEEKGRIFFRTRIAVKVSDPAGHVLTRTNVHPNDWKSLDIAPELAAEWKFDERLRLKPNEETGRTIIIDELLRSVDQAWRGLPAGKYLVQVSFDGVSSDALQIEVKKDQETGEAVRLCVAPLNGPAAEYARGAEIKLRCTFKNVSNERQDVYLAQGRFPYPTWLVAKVQNSAGAILTRTERSPEGWYRWNPFPSRASQVLPPNQRWITLAPDEEVVRDVSLTTMLTEIPTLPDGLPVGSYTIQLRLGEIISNELKLTVK